MTLLTKRAKNILLGAGSTLCIHPENMPARPFVHRMRQCINERTDAEALRRDFIMVAADFNSAYEKEVMHTQPQVAEAGE